MDDTTKKDKAIVLAESNGTALIARTRGDEVEVGVLTAREPGSDVAMGGDKEIVNLCDDGQGALDLETVYRPATSSGRVSSRPTTKQYIKNWDAIFGAKKRSASVDIN